MWEVPEVNQIRTQNQAKQDEAKESEARSLFSVRLFTTPWTIAHQAPLSMGFSRQEHWNELACPSPGDLPDPGIKPVSPCSSCIAGKFFTAEPPGNRGGIKSLGREIEKGAMFF